MKRLAALALLALAACGQKEAAPPAAVTSGSAAPTAPPAAVTVASPEVGPIPTKTPASSPWASLDALEGKYPAESGFLDKSVIAPELHKLLGAKYATLAANLEVETPISREGVVLYTTGNKAHAGGEDQAYVVVDPVVQAIEVGLWEKGKFSKVSTPGFALQTPKAVTTMIENAQKMQAQQPKKL